MSAQATAFVWEHSPYRDKTLVVHLAIADVANDLHENRFWMSLRHLATKSRCERLTVRKAIQTLVRDGFLIQIEPVTERAPGVYQLVIDPPGQSVTGQPVTPPGSVSDPPPGQPVTPIPRKDPKREPKTQRARRRPESETLTPERLAYARSCGMTEAQAESEWLIMGRHEFNSPRSDWTATWQTWCDRWTPPKGVTPRAEQTTHPPVRPAPEVAALLGSIGKPMPSGPRILTEWEVRSGQRRGS